MRRLLVVFAAFVQLASSNATRAADHPPAPFAPIPAEDLFRPAAFAQAALSPDGLHLGAIVTDEKDVRHLLLVDLRDQKQTGVRGDEGLDISRFTWLGNEAVLFNPAIDKLYSAGLHVAYLDNLKRSHALNLHDALHVVATPEARPGHALVWVTELADSPKHSGGLVEYDATRAGGKYAGLHNKTLVRTYPSPATGTVAAWHANQAGELTLCSVWRDGAIHLNRYFAASNNWMELPLHLGRFSPMALDPDDHFLWLVAHDPKTGYELRRLNLDTHDLGSPVLTDPLYNVGDGRLYFSRRTHALAGISYLQRKRISQWIAPDFAAAQAIVDKNYSGTSNLLIDHDDAERKFLFALTGPQRPAVYVLLDLDRKSLDQIAEAAPWLADKPLAPVQPVSFRTRDGSKLEGYLTVPPGIDEQHPAPLVVLPHGGPWVRDTADFDPEVQFLASRGYLVFQPNYRGSSGYTPDISDDYDYNFRRMHDDVTDGTKAMLRSGLVDPKRVAIMGGSFGGYLALTGVAFEDGLYRCAISECGVFDWERFAKSKKDAGHVIAYERLVAGIGKPGVNKESFERVSPLAHADQIKVPVLIAHGTKDNVVDFAQSRKLAAALEARGIPHETFFRKLEGHGFFNYKNRVDFYHRVEAFLSANLGGASLSGAK